MTAISLQKLYASATEPTYSTAGSAGMDLYAHTDKPIEIPTQSIALIPTGIAIALPDGLEAQIRSRSGLAAKNGIFCLNSPGTIDSDYRGEIKVILANFGKETFLVNNGDRIAQMVIAQFQKVSWNVVDSLEATQRGVGGFGSTGV